MHREAEDTQEKKLVRCRKQYHRLSMVFGSTSSMKLQSLQCLRGIAALLVLYVHSGLPPKVGAFGVDIFFVLSGVVMAMLMQRPRTKPLEFLKARAVRIWPLYALVSVAYGVLISIKTPELAPSVFDYLGTLTLAPYCPAANWKPLLFVGWTLHYEAFFYGCCAAALWLFPRRPAEGTSILVCSSFLVSLALGFNPKSSFFANPILLEFVAGLILWSVCKNIPQTLAQRLGLAISIALLGLAGFCEVTVPGMGMPGGEWKRITFLAPLAIALVGTVLTSDLSGKPTFKSATPSLSKLGDASYAVYLVHIPIFLVVKNLTTHLGNETLIACRGQVSIIFAILSGIVVHKVVDSRIQQSLRGRKAA